MSAARLIIEQPGQGSRVVEVSAPVLSLGRRPDNTVCVEESGVSKYHAVIERRGGAYFIADLGSSNGTTVNDEPVKAQRPLRHNDLICLGGAVTLQFHLEGAQGEDDAAHAAANGAPHPAMPSVPTIPGAPALPSTPALPAGPTLPGAHSIPGAPRLPNTPALPGASALPGSAALHNATSLPAGLRPPSTPALPSAPTLQTPAAVHRILGMPRALFVSLAGLLTVGGLLAVLWGTGVVGGAKPAGSDLMRDPLEELETGGAAKEGKGAGAEASEQADEKAEEAPTAPAPAAAPPAASAATATDATGSLARILASQISQKSSYVFDPRFVDYIKMYMNEYRGATNYFERAAKYRDAIDREFVNTQGIQPLVPYLLALSQTKFVERGEGGVWNLPPAVLSAYPSAGGSDDPDASTRAAAAYTRSLLDVFDKEDFMYAVACYGMTVDEAGKVRLALEDKDPGRQGRGDFWKMKSAGVVQGAQVERVARFFAAGIVFENPSQFGLKGKPLSSLY